MISYASTVDRNYKRFASAHANCDNVAYLHHPSGVTVLVLNQPLTSRVVNVDFGGSRKGGVDRADTKVSGRGKKGGLYLQPGTRVCTIECEDGTSVVVRAGVQGSLVEVNDRLFDNPDLVRTSPENLGYICVIMYGAQHRLPNGGFGKEFPKKYVQIQMDE
ncbi:hypothetical protein WR25_18962 [Diploscapter pachys]|uniref:Protein Abitram n=1 Tax=Diploscapter pachys TaxID=2018661 RepID=A0A2A2LZZ3_9BILA|nr:hypothetical protein WR25_18962 [Diploscapter pachys]